MSYQSERKEKDCLNCGTLVQGRFCHVCGQENINAHRDFWTLVTDFIYDIFHFDGKFFDTLKYLFFKPGKVALDYALGKRAKYVDPIRMYLFTSAIFFLVFFSVNQTQIIFNSKDSMILDMADRMELAMILSDRERKFPNDSTVRKQMESLLDSTQQIRLAAYNGGDSGDVIHFRGGQFVFAARKDTFGSLLGAEPGNWLMRKLSSKSEDFKQQYKDNYDAGANKLYSSFLHRLPYVFFISLPFFAGILYAINSRHKRYAYSDHASFTLFHYTFSFILLLLGFTFDFLGKVSGWPVFRWTITALLLLWPIHLLISLKRFYSLSYGQAAVKFIVLNFLASIVLLVLFIIFLLFTVGI